MFIFQLHYSKVIILIFETLLISLSDINNIKIELFFSSPYFNL